jgi:hypothetical protein
VAVQVEGPAAVGAQSFVNAVAERKSVSRTETRASSAGSTAPFTEAKKPPAAVTDRGSEVAGAVPHLEAAPSGVRIPMRLQPPSRVAFEET